MRSLITGSADITQSILEKMPDEEIAVLDRQNNHALNLLAQRSLAGCAAKELKHYEEIGIALIDKMTAAEVCHPNFQRLPALIYAMDNNNLELARHILLKTMPEPALHQKMIDLLKNRHLSLDMVRNIFETANVSNLSVEDAHILLLKVHQHPEAALFHTDYLVRSAYIDELERAAGYQSPFRREAFERALSGFDRAFNVDNELLIKFLSAAQAALQYSDEDIARETAALKDGPLKQLKLRMDRYETLPHSDNGWNIIRGN
ncbi:MAG: hypothetical protein V4534_00405 [Myxococcota bacterium]